MRRLPSQRSSAPAGRQPVGSEALPHCRCRPGQARPRTLAAGLPSPAGCSVASRGSNFALRACVAIWNRSTPHRLVPSHGQLPTCGSSTVISESRAGFWQRSSAQPLAGPQQQQRQWTQQATSAAHRPVASPHSSSSGGGRGGGSGSTDSSGRRESIVAAMREAKAPTVVAAARVVLAAVLSAAGDSDDGGRDEQHARSGRASRWTGAGKEPVIYSSRENATCPTP